MSETTVAKRETKKAAKEREREEARATLRKFLPPGSQVRSVLRHVSRSGMVRHIDFYHYAPNSDNGRGGADGYYLTGYIATALGYRRTQRGALIVGGCGMDMAYHVVHNLSYALHGMQGADGREGGYTLNHDSI